MSQIKCTNLTIGYESKAILEGLSFLVNSGDYLCIVGENGSGKSTLMKTLLGLIEPISGSIEKAPEIKGSGIGYLPQQSPIQKDFPASVMEIVMSGFQGSCKMRPFYTKQEKEKALNNIHHLGIDNFAKKSYRNLSGGQQQRVLLARALCATDKILLLDEPTSGLDPKVTREMYSLLDHLNKSHKITIIMISHDIDEAVSYASHILHIGKKIFFGTTKEYLQSDLYRGFDFSMGGTKDDGNDK